MGVEDVANLVKDDLIRTECLLWDIGYFIIVPAILHLDPTSIIMGKNAAKAFGVDYHVVMYATSISTYNLHQLIQQKISM